MTILDKIFARKLEQLEVLKAGVSLIDMKARAMDVPSTRGFAQRLRESAHSVSLIAEVKKASPVKGMIREDLDPVAIAMSYQRAGVDCLSVLTDEEFFQGSAQFLIDCRAATDLPVIRKDFTADEYHVYEARSMGADCILLIAAMLTKSQVHDYRCIAEELGMDVLVEVHSLEEAEVAIETGAKFVGVNNRDLRTFELNIEATEEIVPWLNSQGAQTVSESALRTHTDIERIAKAGARSALIGTAFCESEPIEDRVREVMGW